MEEGSPELASASAGAVFLSYASQDAEPAETICSTLRAAGVEVWFDRSELRGGEAWDRQIRKQIHDCALFVPIISAHSDARHEGYFRREWRLAVERAGDMAEDVPFLLPVVIDGTPEATARVPDRFREVQWSHLAGGQPSPAFIQRVLRLLSSRRGPGPAPTASSAATGQPAAAASGARGRGTRRGIAAGTVIAAVLLIASYFFARHWLNPRQGAPAAAEEKSIAVLPFVDMSEKHDQEYFSDGLTEELIDRLAHAPDLKVIARTSAFAFKGKNDDVRTIASRLGVANLLEGSVRKSDNALRITAQLIRARDGAHLWSQSYDRGVANVLQIQEEIAGTVSSALQAALAGGSSKADAAVNPDAYSALLRGKYLRERGGPGDMDKSIAALREAISIDPNYADAWVELAHDLNWQGVQGDLPPHEAHARSLEAVHKALAIDPDLASAHRALAILAANYDFDFALYHREWARALELDPHLWLGNSAMIEALVDGRTGDAVIAAQRMVERDPLSVFSRSNLVFALYNDARFAEAEAATQPILELSPLAEGIYAQQAESLLARNQPEKALEAIGHETSERQKKSGLVNVLWALGRRADSTTALRSIEELYGDKDAMGIATAYAYRGDSDGAFRWLDRAYENREPELTLIRGLWDFRGLHGDPRYQALLARMKLGLND